MENSMGNGFMAIFAVSGSIVFLSLQVHKRLLSDFMKKMEFELGIGKGQPKKKVRFANDVVLAEDSKVFDKKLVSNPVVTVAAGSEEVVGLKTMPLNWQVLYKGILDNRKSSY